VTQGSPQASLAQLASQRTPGADPPHGPALLQLPGDAPLDPPLDAPLHPALLPASRPAPLAALRPALPPVLCPAPLAALRPALPAALHSTFRELSIEVGSRPSPHTGSAGLAPGPGTRIGG
jgi:hypothetical protein